MVVRSALPAITLGGVPEHFNVPLMLGVAEGCFARAGVDVAFDVCPGGTGEQLRRLESNELQCCVALTEGLVMGLLSSSFIYRLLGSYVVSPLVWSVAVHPSSSLNLKTLRQTRCGISRFNSGSHLVPFLHALDSGWVSHSTIPSTKPTVVTTAPYDFVVCHDFNGLRTAISAHTADYFLWELATTQKYYNDGSLKHIGNIAPPWSAFSIAIRTDIDEQVCTAIVNGIQASLQHWASLNTTEKVNSIQTALPASYADIDILRWLKNVRFVDPTQVGHVQRADVEKIAQVLKEAGVFQGDVAIDAADMLSPTARLI